MYDALCGRHPDYRPWHSQWLPTWFLHKRFRELFPTLEGRVLDAGCGEAPYRKFFTRASQYTGLDIEGGPAVDVVVAPNEAWPLPDAHFDVVISTQVLEFASDVELTLREIDRVLAPGGTVVVSLPFLYQQHRAPFDLHRFTTDRAEAMFPGYDKRVERQGGFGSTMAILTLNWIDSSLKRTRVTRLLKALLLPLWIPFSFAVNVIGVLVDVLDRTGAFYSNVLVVGRKP